MKFFFTKLKNVFLIKPYIFNDYRGSYTEIYNHNIFKKNKISIRFIQDDISISKKNVLRGIHGDNKTWKLISCLYGKFYLIVVNNDKNSKEYKKWTSFILDDKNKNMVLVPPKFGNGHCILSKKAIFYYKQNTFYNRGDQFTIKWDNKDYKFKWPCRKPILSKRDT
jgi:dTDP-4-dehydrorhamnose 3,5-epimerase